MHGNSGCSLDTVLLKALCKKSPNAEYNKRLRAQARKQNEFQMTKLTSANGDFYFKSPDIYNYGFSGDTFFFNMEIIEGKTLAEVIREKPIEETEKYAKALASFILNELANQRTDESGLDPCLKKLKSIREYCKENTSKFGNLKEFYPYIDALTAKFALGGTEYPFICSKCHGDFTLENMIVPDKEENTLYFIDFLDSDYESGLVDVGAFTQETKYLWSLRKEDVSVEIKNKYNAFYEKFMNELELEELKPGFKDMTILKVLRIIPYIKDVETFNWIKNTLIDLSEDD